MKNSEIAELVRKVWDDRERHIEELIDAIWKTIYYITYKKINNQQEAEDLDIKADEGGGPEALILSQEQHEYLVEIIDGLSQKQKDVIFLFYYQQIPVSHISEILDCSLEAVKSRLYTARKLIKDQLEKQKDEFKLFNFSLAGVLLAAFHHEKAVVCNNNIRERIDINKKSNPASREIVSKKAWAAIIAVGVIICAGIIAAVILQNRNYLQSKEAPSDPVENSDGMILESEDDQEEPDPDMEQSPEPNEPDPEVPVLTADADAPDNQPQSSAVQLLPQAEDILLPAKGRLHIHNYISQTQGTAPAVGAAFRIYKIKDDYFINQPLKAAQVDLTSMVNQTFGAVDIVTGANGIASITLARGIYYVVPQEGAAENTAVLAKPILISVR